MVCLAELYMARMDAQAAIQTMQRAIEANRLALGAKWNFLNPALAESVLGLAAIYRKSGRSKDSVELLKKDLAFLTEGEERPSPGDTQRLLMHGLY